MGQQHFRAKKATVKECVYNSNPRTPLQSTANTPAHPLDERRVVGEDDGGVKEVGEEKKVEKKVRKKRRFFRKLFCFHFSRPRAGTKARVEKVEQSERLEQDVEAGPSRCSPDDQISVEHITCIVEDCDDQEAPNSSPAVLPSSEDQPMQQHLQPGVQISPVNVSEGQIQPNSDLDMSTQNIFSNYVIGKKLGEGGFGDVYAGKRSKDGLPVALKFAKKTEDIEYINLPDHPKPVPLEIGLTVLANTGSSSPHIIQLLDWQDLPDHYVMVLEHPSPCVSLSEYLEKFGGIINEEMARHVMQQVVEAAISCCRRGILHRDIKEGNILVNTDTVNVTLIDFGCGDLLYETAYHTFSGTMQCCPPEYFSEGKYYGRPATVFSLGVLLYSMVCGYLPDESDQDKLRDWLWYLPSLTKECSHLINACLHPVPEERISLDRLLLHDWFQVIPCVVEMSTLSRPPRKCSLVSLASGGLTPSLQSFASCEAGKPLVASGASA